MKLLADVIATHENWLMKRVLGYAKERNYVKYTSTLVETWRISIAGLSERLLSALETYDSVPELGPDEDYTQDPIASFGILEAQRHRARGVTLDMFLGLMKYYRQSYVDLVLQAGFEPEHQDHCRLLVDRFFDRVELGFCMEWTALGENEKTEELQVSNRDMTNEKNKYLTTFESLYDPVILLDRENQVENINQAAIEIFDLIGISGAKYYDKTPTQQALPWLDKELGPLMHSNKPGLILEKELETKKGMRHFQIKLKRMLDVSENFTGTVVIFNDITERKEAEERLQKHRDSLEELLEKRAADLTKANRELQQEIEERRQAEEQMRRKSTVMEAINKVFHETLLCETQEEVAYTCINMAEALTGSEYGLIGEINEAGRFDTITYGDLGWAICKMPESDAVALSKNMEIRGIWAQAILKGKSQIVNDPTSHPNRVGVPEGHPQISTFLGVPLKHAGKTIGMIGLANKESGYTADDQQAIEDLSVAFVEALNRKRAEQRIYHLNTVLHAIRKVNQLIVQEKDADQLIKGTCDNLVENRGYHSAWIALLDGAQKPVRAAGAGLDRDFISFVEQLEGGDWTNCAKRALKQPSVLVISDPVSMCKNCLLSASCHGTGAMITRLEHGGRLYGLFTISLPSEFTAVEEEQGLFQEVAGDIAYALYGIEQERERKRAEEVLRQSEDKYRNLYESSRDGILFSDMEGKLVDANQAFLDMVGYEKEELRKLTYKELTPAKWHDIERGVLERQILVTGYSSEYEKEYIRKDGSLFPVAMRAWLTRDEQENPSGMWALVRDMSEYKLLEQRRIMTEKMTALGTLTAGVAHELNNPMMGMLNFTQYCLKKTPGDDPRYALLQDTERETRRCIEIVKNLLTFSRMNQEGAKTYRKENIATVCNRVLALLSYRIEQENVSVSQRIAEDTPAIPMSVSSIQQVFLNLIANSLDALGGHSKKEIHIDIHPSGDSLEVTMADSGCGVSSENLQKIFDPFFTTKPVGKGTGLGLSVSRSIVHAHGGIITCESEVGKGAKFIIRLPIRKD